MEKIELQLQAIANFREQIQIADKLISQNTNIDFWEKVKAASQMCERVCLSEINALSSKVEAPLTNVMIAEQFEGRHALPQ